MTAFREGRTRAHVMEWAGSRSRWEPLCNSPRLNIAPDEWQDRDGWPMRYDTADRSVPWCRRCAKAVQREVDRLVTDVLDPAAREARRERRRGRIARAYSQEVGQ